MKHSKSFAQLGSFPLLDVGEAYKDAYPEANRLAIQAHILVGLTGAEQRQKIEKLLRDLGWPISQAAYSIIRLLYLTEGQQLAHKEIAIDLGSTPGNVTQVMNSLVQKGLVKRKGSEGSRRVTLACLTERGRECAETVVPAMLQFMHQTCSRLSEDETTQLSYLLRRYLVGLLSVQDD